MKSYIPEVGDIVWLTFDPQSGSEQNGRRPALALSPKIHNQKSGLRIFVPITKKIKGYPFEVVLNDKFVQGAILSDQIKSLDYRARDVKFYERVDKKTLQKVRKNISLLICQKQARTYL